MLRAAVSKCTSGAPYDPVADATVTDFWCHYWEHCQSEARELRMEEPGDKPAGATFVYFRHIEGMPATVDIFHTLWHAVADLQLRGMGTCLQDARDAFEDVLDPDMRVRRAAGSGAISIDVPQLAVGRSSESQTEQVDKGLDAAKRLPRLRQVHGHDLSLQGVSGGVAGVSAQHESTCQVCSRTERPGKDSCDSLPCRCTAASCDLAAYGTGASDAGGPRACHALGGMSGNTTRISQEVAEIRARFKMLGDIPTRGLRHLVAL